MNERINELIKSVKDLKYDSSTGTFETDRRALFDFAELIVRECIANCDDLNSMKYIANHFSIKLEGVTE